MCPISFGNISTETSPFSMCSCLIQRTSNCSSAPFSISLNARSNAGLITRYLLFVCGGSTTVINTNNNHFCNIFKSRFRWSRRTVIFLHHIPSSLARSRWFIPSTIITLNRASVLARSRHVFQFSLANIKTLYELVRSCCTNSGICILQVNITTFLSLHVRSMHFTFASLCKFLSD